MNLDLDLKTLGKCIAHLREERGLRQIDLAELAEINDKYLGGIEGGKRKPSISVMYRIAQALDVSVSHLVGDEAKPPSALSQTDDEFLMVYTSASDFEKMQIRKLTEILIVNKPRFDS